MNYLQIYTFFAKLPPFSPNNIHPSVYRNPHSPPFPAIISPLPQPIRNIPLLLLNTLFPISVTDTALQNPGHSPSSTDALWSILPHPY